MAQPLLPAQAPESNENNVTSVQTQAEIDAAHGTTGWNAYEVWRKRVLAPRVDLPAQAQGSPLRE